jgi:hypothetical protein
VSDFALIDGEYAWRKMAQSDIWEHLPTLKRLASECDRIVEFGSAWCNSTFALLAGRPRWMRAYDLKRYEPAFTLVEDAARAGGIDFAFEIQSSTNTEFGLIDLLFIDSAHYYEHCSEELAMHGGKVSKYIVFHDTTEFEFTNENRQGKGLWPAIEDYMAFTGCWHVAERYINSNGLTVLKRRTR